MCWYILKKTTTTQKDSKKQLKQNGKRKQNNGNTKDKRRNGETIVYKLKKKNEWNFLDAINLTSTPPSKKKKKKKRRKGNEKKYNKERKKEKIREEKWIKSVIHLHSSHLYWSEKRKEGRKKEHISHREPVPYLQVTQTQNKIIEHG